MALIACEDVSFAYDEGVVVSNLNFAVEPGDYLCVVGENGTGKTTLMKGLLRLKQPRGGRIRFGEGLGPGQVGYLPQQMETHRDFPASVWEVALSGRRSARGLRPFYTRQDMRTAEEALRRMGVLELKRRCYRELSAGQRQRVLLCRALCAAGRLLLLDEPASGLDPLAAQDFYRLVKELNREAGLTVVMISHDVKAAVGSASHILHLAHQQLFFGKTEDYLETDAAHTLLGGASC